jgi:hypothetical protein
VVMCVFVMYSFLQERLSSISKSFPPGKKKFPAARAACQIPLHLRTEMNQILVGFADHQRFSIGPLRLSRANCFSLLARPANLDERSNPG